ncbi:hypothetical protein Ahia01_001087500 [Argonauta hians]
MSANKKRGVSSRVAKGEQALKCGSGSNGRPGRSVVESGEDTPPPTAKSSEKSSSKSNENSGNATPKMPVNSKAGGGRKAGRPRKPRNADGDDSSTTSSPPPSSSSSTSSSSSSQNPATLSTASGPLSSASAKKRGRKAKNPEPPAPAVATASPSKKKNVNKRAVEIVDTSKAAIDKLQKKKATTTTTTTTGKGSKLLPTSKKKNIGKVYSDKGILNKVKKVTSTTPATTTSEVKGGAGKKASKDLHTVNNSKLKPSVAAAAALQKVLNKGSKAKKILTNSDATISTTDAVEGSKMGKSKKVSHNNNNNNNNNSSSKDSSGAGLKKVKLKTLMKIKKSGNSTPQPPQPPASSASAKKRKIPQAESEDSKKKTKAKKIVQNTPVAAVSKRKSKSGTNNNKKTDLAESDSVGSKGQLVIKKKATTSPVKGTSKKVAAAAVQKTLNTNNNKVDKLKLSDTLKLKKYNKVIRDTPTTTTTITVAKVLDTTTTDSVTLLSSKFELSDNNNSSSSSSDGGDSGGGGSKSAETKEAASLSKTNCLQTLVKTGSDCDPSRVEGVGVYDGSDVSQDSSKLGLSGHPVSNAIDVMGKTLKEEGDDMSSNTEASEALVSNSKKLPDLSATNEEPLADVVHSEDIPTACSENIPTCGEDRTMVCDEDIPTACSENVPTACGEEMIAACDGDKTTVCREDIPTACGENIPTTCSEDIPTACGDDRTTACGDDRTTACGENIPTTCSEDIPTACGEDQTIQCTVDSEEVNTQCTVDSHEVTTQCAAVYGEEVSSACSQGVTTMDSDDVNTQSTMDSDQVTTPYTLDSEDVNTHSTMDSERVGTPCTEESEVAEELHTPCSVLSEQVNTSCSIDSTEAVTESSEQMHTPGWMDADDSSSCKPAAPDLSVHRVARSPHAKPVQSANTSSPHNPPHKDQEEEGDDEDDVCLSQLSCVRSQQNCPAGKVTEPSVLEDDQPGGEQQDQPKQETVDLSWETKPAEPKQAESMSKAEADEDIDARASSMEMSPLLLELSPADSDAHIVEDGGTANSPSSCVVAVHDAPPPPNQASELADHHHHPAGPPSYEGDTMKQSEDLSTPTTSTLTAPKDTYCKQDSLHLEHVAVLESQSSPSDPCLDPAHSDKPETESGVVVVSDAAPVCSRGEDQDQGVEIVLGEFRGQEGTDKGLSVNSSSSNPAPVVSADTSCDLSRDPPVDVSTLGLVSVIAPPRPSIISSLLRRPTVMPPTANVTLPTTNVTPPTCVPHQTPPTQNITTPMSVIRAMASAEVGVSPSLVMEMLAPPLPAPPPNPPPLPLLSPHTSSSLSSSTPPPPPTQQQQPSSSLSSSELLASSSSLSSLYSSPSPQSSGPGVPHVNNDPSAPDSSVVGHQLGPEDTVSAITSPSPPSTTSPPLTTAESSSSSYTSQSPSLLADNAKRDDAVAAMETDAATADECNNYNNNNYNNAPPALAPLSSPSPSSSSSLSSQQQQSGLEMVVAETEEEKTLGAVEIISVDPQQPTTTATINSPSATLPPAVVEVDQPSSLEQQEIEGQVDEKPLPGGIVQESTDFGDDFDGSCIANDDDNDGGDGVGVGDLNSEMQWQNTLTPTTATTTSVGEEEEEVPAEVYDSSSGGSSSSNSNIAVSVIKCGGGAGGGSDNVDSSGGLVAEPGQPECETLYESEGPINPTSPTSPTATPSCSSTKDSPPFTEVVTSEALNLHHHQQHHDDCTSNIEGCNNNNTSSYSAEHANNNNNDDDGENEGGFPGCATAETDSAFTESHHPASPHLENTELSHVTPAVSSPVLASVNNSDDECDTPLNVGGPQDESDTPLSVGGPRDECETPLNVGGHQDESDTPLNVGGPQDECETPLNVVGPEDVCESPLNVGGPQDESETQLNVGGPQDESETQLNVGGPQDESETPLNIGCTQDEDNLPLIVGNAENEYESPLNVGGPQDECESPLNVGGPEDEPNISQTECGMVTHEEVPQLCLTEPDPSEPAAAEDLECELPTADGAQSESADPRTAETLLDTSEEADVLLDVDTPQHEAGILHEHSNGNQGEPNAAFTYMDPSSMVVGEDPLGPSIEGQAPAEEPDVLISVDSPPRDEPHPGYTLAEVPSVPLSDVSSGPQYEEQAAEILPDGGIHQGQAGTTPEADHVVFEAPGMLLGPSAGDLTMSMDTGEPEVEPSSNSPAVAPDEAAVQPQHVEGDDGSGNVRDMTQPPAVTTVMAAEEEKREAEEDEEKINIDSQADLGASLEDAQMMSDTEYASSTTTTATTLPLSHLPTSGDTLGVVESGEGGQDPTGTSSELSHQNIPHDGTPCSSTPPPQPAPSSSSTSVILPSASSSLSPPPPPPPQQLSSSPSSSSSSQLAVSSSSVVGVGEGGDDVKEGKVDREEEEDRTTVTTTTTTTMEKISGKFIVKSEEGAAALNGRGVSEGMGVGEALTAVAAAAASGMGLLNAVSKLDCTDDSYINSSSSSGGSESKLTTTTTAAAATTTATTTTVITMAETPPPPPPPPPRQPSEEDSVIQSEEATSTTTTTSPCSSSSLTTTTTTTTTIATTNTTTTSTTTTNNNNSAMWSNNPGAFFLGNPPPTTTTMEPSSSSVGFPALSASAPVKTEGLLPLDPANIKVESSDDTSLSHLSSSMVIAPAAAQRILSLATLANKVTLRAEPGVVPVIKKSRSMEGSEGGDLLSAGGVTSSTSTTRVDQKVQEGSLSKFSEEGANVKDVICDSSAPEGGLERSHVDPTSRPRDAVVAPSLTPNIVDITNDKPSDKCNTTTAADSAQLTGQLKPSFAVFDSCLVCILCRKMCKSKKSFQMHVWWHFHHAGTQMCTHCVQQQPPDPGNNSSSASVMQYSQQSNKCPYVVDVMMKIGRTIKNIRQAKRRRRRSGKDNPATREKSFAEEETDTESLDLDYDDMNNGGSGGGGESKMSATTTTTATLENSSGSSSGKTVNNTNTTTSSGSTDDNSIFAPANVEYLRSLYSSSSNTKKRAKKSSSGGPNHHHHHHHHHHHSSSSSSSSMALAAAAGAASSHKKGGFYVCGFQYCTYSCMNCLQFRLHLQQCHNFETVFPCYHCGQLNYSKDDLIKHMYNHSNARDFLLFRCWFPRCRFGTNMLQEFHEHNNIFHVGELVFTCFYCNTEFSELSELLNHLQSNLLKFVQCPHCTVKDRNRRTVLNHISTEHPLKPKQIVVTCQVVCKKKQSISPDASEMLHNQHLRLSQSLSEERILECIKCGLICRNIATLRKHSRVCLRDALSKKSFSSQRENNLTMIYSCQWCSFPAASDTMLFQHTVDQHPGKNANFEQIELKALDSGFSDYENLSRMSSWLEATKTEAIICPYCKVGFDDELQWSDHMEHEHNHEEHLVKEEEEDDGGHLSKYRCDFCEFNGISEKDLLDHQQMMTISEGPDGLHRRVVDLANVTPKVTMLTDTKLTVSNVQSFKKFKRSPSKKLNNAFFKCSGCHFRSLSKWQSLRHVKHCSLAKRRLAEYMKKRGVAGGGAAGAFVSREDVKPDMDIYNFPESNSGSSSSSSDRLSFTAATTNSTNNSSSNNNNSSSSGSVTTTTSSSIISSSSCSDEQMRNKKSSRMTSYMRDKQMNLMAKEGIVDCTDGDGYKCSICKHTGKTMINIRQHLWKTHLKLKPVRCPCCPFTSWKNYTLEKHKISKHKHSHPNLSDQEMKSLAQNLQGTADGLVECQLCFYKSPSPYKVRTHLWRTHMHLEMKQCRSCSYKCWYWYLMNMHRLSRHKVKGDANFTKQQQQQQQQQQQLQQKSQGESQNVEGSAESNSEDKGSGGKDGSVGDGENTVMSDEDMSQLAKELMERKADNKYECTVCKYGCTRIMIMKIHIWKRHLHVKQRRCPHCPYTCWLETRLAQHVCRIIGGGGSGSAPCDGGNSDGGGDGDGGGGGGGCGGGGDDGVTTTTTTMEGVQESKSRWVISKADEHGCKLYINKSKRPHKRLSFEEFGRPCPKKFRSLSEGGSVGAAPANGSADSSVDGLEDPEVSSSSFAKGSKNFSWIHQRHDKSVSQCFFRVDDKKLFARTTDRLNQLEIYTCVYCSYKSWNMEAMCHHTYKHKLQCAYCLFRAYSRKKIAEHIGEFHPGAPVKIVLDNNFKKYQMVFPSLGSRDRFRTKGGNTGGGGGGKTNTTTTTTAAGETYPRPHQRRRSSGGGGGTNKVINLDESEDANSDEDDSDSTTSDWRPSSDGGSDDGGGRGRGGRGRKGGGGGDDSYITRYCCCYCSMRTHDFDRFRRHIVKHSRSHEELHCPSCSYRTHDTYKYEHHMKKHPQEHFCAYCTFSSMQESFVQLHVRRLHPKKPMQVHSRSRVAPSSATGGTRGEGGRANLSVRVVLNDFLALDTPEFDSLMKANSVHSIDLEDIVLEEDKLLSVL